MEFKKPPPSEGGSMLESFVGELTAFNGITVAIVLFAVFTVLTALLYMRLADRKRSDASSSAESGLPPRFSDGEIAKLEARNRTRL